MVHKTLVKPPASRKQHLFTEFWTLYEFYLSVRSLLMEEAMFLTYLACNLYETNNVIRIGSIKYLHGRFNLLIKN